MAARKKLLGTETGTCLEDLRQRGQRIVLRHPPGLSYTALSAILAVEETRQDALFLTGGRSRAAAGPPIIILLPMSMSWLLWRRQQLPELLQAHVGDVAHAVGLLRQRHHVVVVPDDGDAIRRHLRPKPSCRQSAALHLWSRTSGLVQPLCFRGHNFLGPQTVEGVLCEQPCITVVHLHIELHK